MYFLLIDVCFAMLFFTANGNRRLKFARIVLPEFTALLDG